MKVYAVFSSNCIDHLVRISTIFPEEGNWQEVSGDHRYFALRNREIDCDHHDTLWSGNVELDGMVQVLSYIKCSSPVPVTFYTLHGDENHIDSVSAMWILAEVHPKYYPDKDFLAPDLSHVTVLYFSGNSCPDTILHEAQALNQAYKECLMYDITKAWEISREWCKFIEQWLDQHIKVIDSLDGLKAC